MFLSIINAPTAVFKQFPPLFSSPAYGIPCGSLTFRIRYLLIVWRCRSTPGAYSCLPPAFPGNIPGIPHSSAFRWVLPAPSESQASKKIACNLRFPCLGHISFPFPAEEKLMGAIPANFASCFALGKTINIPYLREDIRRCNGVDPRHGHQ